MTAQDTQIYKLLRQAFPDAEISTCPRCEKIYVRRDGMAYCIDCADVKVERLLFDKQCPVCGRQFSTTYKNKVYCHPKCQKNANREIMREHYHERKGAP